MNEIAPVPKPIQRGVGDFDWDRAPDQLFTIAFNLVSKAKQNSVVSEGLQMIMTLKQKEAMIMAQQMMVKHEDGYIKTRGEDIMFTKIALANDRKKLRSYQADRTALLEEYKKRKSKNLALQEACNESETTFNQMLDLINPQWQGMDMDVQASFHSVLLRLLDFYSKSGQ